MFMARYDDPDGKRYGIPTFNFRHAPEGLATKRQLAAQGLRPGGQDICAQIMWLRHNKTAYAYLYRIELAKPKRKPTPKQLAAIAKALQARRTCQTCGVEKQYYIPLRYGECNDCSGYLNYTNRPAPIESEPPRRDYTIICATRQ